jgi:Flp pilus assembly protein TadB
MSDRRIEAPPAGEELHLPGNSVVPLLNAVGLAIAVLGLTTGILLIIVGLVIFFSTLLMWVRDTRRDIEALPGEHRTH